MKNQTIKDLEILEKYLLPIVNTISTFRYFFTDEWKDESYRNKNNFFKLKKPLK